MAKAKATEYVVVEAPSAAEFEKAVTTMMGEGWSLQGGVCVFGVQGEYAFEWYYHQAMVRPRPTE